MKKYILTVLLLLVNLCLSAQIISGENLGYTPPSIISKDTPLNKTTTQKMYCLLHNKDYITSFESDCIYFNQWEKEDFGKEIIILFPDDINGIKLYAQYGIYNDFVGTEEQIKNRTIKIPDDLPLEDQIQPFLYKEKLYKGGIVRKFTNIQGKQLYIGGVINSPNKEFHPVDVIYKIVASPAIKNPNPPKQTEEKENGISANIENTARSYVASITPQKEYEGISFNNKALFLNGSLSTDPKDALVSIDYIDGLGRPVQTIQRRITPQEKDLVTLQEYDGLGRESNTWLSGSVSTDNDGAFISFDAARSYIQASNLNDLAAYSKPLYESSPLNRVMEQYGPGQSWHNAGKTINTNYKINIVGDNLLDCKLYKVNGNTLTNTGNYATGELYVTEIKDEDGNASYEFKDKLGQVVLTRQIENFTTHDTYYVYDDFGNQCFVLPPRIQDEGIGRTKLDELAYQYRFDNRNRCIWKKLPGCEPIYFVYDNADQLIFTQDGEQRENGKWLFTIPDALGRPVLSGICSDTLNVYNTAVKAAFTGNGAYKGYVIKVGNDFSSSLSPSNLLSVNYYDNYGFMNMIPNSFIYTYDTSKEAEGYGKYYNEERGYESKALLTGTITFTFGSQTELHSVMYYDNRKRLIQSRSNNHLGGFESEYVAYNFTGQPLKKLHVHTGKDNASSSKVEELYTYTYDHAGRLTETRHKIDDLPEIILSQFQYDELGRIQGKSMGISE